jgi:hypothetical protein
MCKAAFREICITEQIRLVCVLLDFRSSKTGESSSEVQRDGPMLNSQIFSSPTDPLPKRTPWVSFTRKSTAHHPPRSAQRTHLMGATDPIQMFLMLCRTQHFLFRDPIASNCYVETCFRPPSLSPRRQPALKSTVLQCFRLHLPRTDDKQNTFSV